MTIQTIKAEILSMDRKQLNDLVDTIQYRRKLINQKLKDEYSVGDLVSFDSKSGNKINGKVIKINRKSIQVEDLDCKWNVWNVSPSLLKSGKDK